MTDRRLRRTPGTHEPPQAIRPGETEPRHGRPEIAPRSAVGSLSDRSTDRDHMQRLARSVHGPIHVLRRGEVVLRTTISPAQIHRLVDRNQFPRPIRVGRRACGWLDYHIDAWLLARIMARDQLSRTGQQDTGLDEPWMSHVDHARNSQPRIQLLRLRDVVASVGLSRSSIYSAMPEGRFPRQVSIGIRSRAWVAREILSWLRCRTD